MTPLPKLSVIEMNFDASLNYDGQLVILVSEDGKLDDFGDRLNKLMDGAIDRALASDIFHSLDLGKVLSLSYPAGLKAQGLTIAKLNQNSGVDETRACGVEIAKIVKCKSILILNGEFQKAADLVEGLALRNYDYRDQKTHVKNTGFDLQVMVQSVREHSDKINEKLAVIDGVFFTRDLINAPANILTTSSFADQLLALSELGIIVEVLDEPELEKLGMRTLLCVGQGSVSPSKVVVMHWNGGGSEAPFAFVGKGVVFDTGGISLKPAAGMEDMTMDMGGAGVVAGAMKALALRKAKANVVGVVGLVENMPSGNATRPGDVIKSMKGDTVEVINTDAEGRLVLADILWYTQERFNPTGMIDLATLTGAIIIGLGHEMAGVFSNSDTLSKQFISAATAEGEGAWRMPLGQAYDKQLKSRIADMKNVGGRAASSITAGQFLKRFVKDNTPWAHLDIAGVASIAQESAFSPKGATGWGVRALNRMIADHYEGTEQEPSG
ncbi:MAG: leucyl aminopeptidase [Planktomarina sp.]|nr:leucyl aminopeptidase [Planktomarina sp.]